MSWSSWVDATDPKVKGTWNLHQAFLQHDLDYFWLASSTVTVVDQPGQGNYKAGCVFTEAFCQFRHSLGLRASVLCISPIDDVGFVAENAWALRNVKVQGLYTLGEKEFLESVEVSLLNSSSPVPWDNDELLSRNLNGVAKPGPLHPWEHGAQVVMGLRSELHLGDAKNTTNWRRDRRMGIYHNSSQVASTSAVSDSDGLKLLRENLAAAAEAGTVDELLSDPATTELLIIETGQKIHDFLLKPTGTDIDAELSLSQMGLDSLTAIELRRWFRKALGLQISVLEIMESASLKHLVGTVANKMKT